MMLPYRRYSSSPPPLSSPLPARVCLLTPQNDYFEVPLGSIVKFSKDAASASPGLFVVSFTTRDLRAECLGMSSVAAKDFLSLLKKRANPQSTATTFAVSNKESFASDGWQVYDVRYTFQRYPHPLHRCDPNSIGKAFLGSIGASRLLMMPTTSAIAIPAACRYQVKCAGSTSIQYRSSEVVVVSKC